MSLKGHSSFRAPLTTTEAADLRGINHMAVRLPLPSHALLASCVPGGRLNKPSVSSALSQDVLAGNLISDCVFRERDESCGSGMGTMRTK